MNWNSTTTLWIQEFLLSELILLLLSIKELTHKRWSSLPQVKGRSWTQSVQSLGPVLFSLPGYGWHRWRGGSLWGRNPGFVLRVWKLVLWLLSPLFWILWELIKNLGAVGSLNRGVSAMQWPWPRPWTSATLWCGVMSSIFCGSTIGFLSNAFTFYIMTLFYALKCKGTIFHLFLINRKLFMERNVSPHITQNKK